MSQLFYKQGSRYKEATPDMVCEEAARIGLPTVGEALTSSDASCRWVRAYTAGLPHEVFGVVLLDNRHRVLNSDTLFRGTVDGASVYPHEVVKYALEHNAAATILFHNHPSGVAEPSGADRRLTDRLRDALALIDVRVLDHLIVGQHDVVSFANRGLI